MLGKGLVIACIFDAAEEAPAAGVDLRDKTGASFQPCSGFDRGGGGAEAATGCRFAKLGEASRTAGGAGKPDPGVPVGAYGSLTGPCACEGKAGAKEAEFEEGAPIEGGFEP